MALVGGDDRLIAAHVTAVRETLQEAEKYSATRVRLAGLYENRTTRNWVVAAHTHDTSRELDPQLHTHAVAAELTYDGAEARWKALQAFGLYERRSYRTEVYRNALAREVRALGYGLKTDATLPVKIRDLKSAACPRRPSTSTVGGVRSAMLSSCVPGLPTRFGTKPLFRY